MQGVHAGEEVIKLRYPKDCPFRNHKQTPSGFRQLVDPYQIHCHSKRCRLPDGRCRFGSPREISHQARIRRHNHQLTYDSQEVRIVRHSPLRLANFRCHHCLKVIHSEQCIGYVLKYCSKISDSGRVSLRNCVHWGDDYFINLGSPYDFLLSSSLSQKQ
jgi:hypothetical protein